MTGADTIGPFFAVSAMLFWGAWGLLVALFGVSNAGVSLEDGRYCANGVCYNAAFSGSPAAFEPPSPPPTPMPATADDDEDADARLLRDTTAAFQAALARVHDPADAQRRYLVLRMGGAPQACRAQGTWGKMMRIASAAAWAAAQPRAVVLSDADNWVNADPAACAAGGLSCYVRAPDAGASGCGAGLAALAACAGSRARERLPVTATGRDADADADTPTVHWSACMHENQKRLGGPTDSTLRGDRGTNTWFGTRYTGGIGLPGDGPYATALDASRALWPDRGADAAAAAAAVKRAGAELRHRRSYAAAQLYGGYDHAAGWLAGNVLGFLLLGRRRGADAGDADVVGGVQPGIRDFVAAAHAGWAANGDEGGPCAAGVHVRRGDKYRNRREDVEAFLTYYLPALREALADATPPAAGSGELRVHVATDSANLAAWIGEHPTHPLLTEDDDGEKGPRLRLLVADASTPRNAWQGGRGAGRRYNVTREAHGSFRDVLLLSECARVLGNPYSAFSQACAALAVYRRAREGKRARVTWVPFPGIDRF